MTERKFFENLHKKGYEVKVGKDISVRPPGKDRFVCLARNFGEDYTLEGIRSRILEQSRPARPLPEPAPKTKRYRVPGTWNGRKKVTGFRALHFHYCYLLGVFPKNKQQNKRRLHFLLRADLIKLDAITQEARLLGTNHIDTAQQLFSYKENLETRIDAHTLQRKQLYRKQRTVAVKADEAASVQVKAQIDSLSRELRKLRREVKLCSDIQVRSGIMQEHIKTVREDEESKRKELKEHCPLRKESHFSYCL